MGLVPTKLQIFQLRRKFLRFVVTRPAREGAVFTAPFEPPRCAPFPTSFRRRLGEASHSERGTPDTPCGVPDRRHDCLATCPRHSPPRA